MISIVGIVEIRRVSGASDYSRAPETSGFSDWMNWKIFAIAFSDKRRAAAFRVRYLYFLQSRVVEYFWFVCVCFFFILSNSRARFNAFAARNSAKLNFNSRLIYKCTDRLFRYGAKRMRGRGNWKTITLRGFTSLYPNDMGVYKKGNLFKYKYFMRHVFTFSSTFKWLLSLKNGQIYKISYKYKTL